MGVAMPIYRIEALQILKHIVFYENDVPPTPRQAKKLVEDGLIWADYNEAEDLGVLEASIHIVKDGPTGN